MAIMTIARVVSFIKLLCFIKLEVLNTVRFLRFFLFTHRRVIYLFSSMAFYISFMYRTNMISARRPFWW